LPPIAIEELRRALKEAERERDAARHERNQIRREFEEACEQRDARRGTLPKPEVVGDPARICWCSFCGMRWGDHPRLGLEKPQVETMIAGSVGHRTFICNECIEKFNAILAEKRSRRPQST
jgi:hypothetical protein